MNTQKYLLLIEPRDEILTLQTSALSCFYPGQVFTLKDSSQISDILRKNGEPEAIIIDSEVYLKGATGLENVSVPVILTTLKPLVDQFPGVTAIVDKPLTAHSFTTLIKGLTSTVTTTPEFIPVSIQVLLRMGITRFDLYLKLSEKNYLKMLHKGETFLEEDYKKLREKNILQLHLRATESSTLLNFLEGEITPMSEDEEIFKLIENLEEFERVVRFLNWTPEVSLTAQKTVTNAVRILSKNKKIVQTLKERFTRSKGYLGRHSGLLSCLVCALGTKLLLSESAQMKLVLSSLIHDVAVDEFYFQDIPEWNKRAGDPSDKSPETIKYRLHPYEASKLVKTLDWISPDIDQIILQHHELIDGTGFPRGLEGGKISYLSALFIIVHDLVGFISHGERLETSIRDFLTWGRVRYDRGHFSKIFTSLEEILTC